MRAGIIKRIITGVLFAVLGANWPAWAQQTPVATSSIAPQVKSAPPLDSSAASDLDSLSDTVALSALVQRALEANPEIKAMQRNIDMTRARIPQAKALPEPRLSVGTAGNVLPLPPFDIQKGDPSSARMLSFSQEVPFPGKLALKGKMANFAAEAEWWNYEQVRLNVVAEVKAAYFELYYIAKASDMVTKNKDLLEKFAKIAEARYSVGKGIQQDVLKAQVEISKLIEQLSLLEQRKLAMEARLNSLLFRNPDLPLGKPEEIKPRELAYGLTELNELARSYSPTLKAQRRKLDREQAGVQLAQKDYYPDFSVGFTYFNRPGMPDMYGFIVDVKLPLYFWQKQRPAVQEAAAGVAVERSRLESLSSQLVYKIKDRYLAATTAGRLVKLYGTTIIPQSTLSLESAISGYEVGRVDFLTLLDNLVTLRNYELSYYEQVSNLEKAVAALEPLVGRNLRP